MCASQARQEGGFALVLVLWGLAILSLISSALIVETRHAASLASARVGEMQAALLAEAGIERSFLAIDAKPDERAWPEDGTPVAWDFAGGSVAIAIEDEAGKVDALNAPDLMLTAALDYAGLTMARQRIVMAQLRDIHSQADFEGALMEVASLDELRGLTSLTSAEIERLRTVLTMRNGLAGFDPQVAGAETVALLPGADPIAVASYLSARKRTVARADIAERPESPAPAFTMRSPRSAFTIRAEACTADGHLAIREAMVRRNAPGSFARLELREPTQPRFMTGCGAPPASRHS